MIRVEMHGRLGNQLFQYAAARAIQEINNEKIVISFRQIYDGANEPVVGWENSLQYFNVKDFVELNTSRSILFYGFHPLQVFSSLIYYFMYKKYSYRMQDLFLYQKKWCPFLDIIGVRWIANGYYKFINFPKNILLNGSFESKQYFDDIRELLINEIQPIEPPLHQNVELMKIIEQTNSICVSIRHFRMTDGRLDTYDVCGYDYYVSAMRYIKNRIPDARFIIFSDDLEWVKDVFDFSDFDVVYETRNNPVWEKLRLMYSCKHFIISNSTFSWWAQYLGRYNNKIVVGPSKWFNNEFISPLIESDWIKINSEGNILDD